MDIPGVGARGVDGRASYCCHRGSSADEANASTLIAVFAKSRHEIAIAPGRGAHLAVLSIEISELGKGKASHTPNTGENAAVTGAVSAALRAQKKIAPPARLHGTPLIRASFALAVKRFIGLSILSCKTMMYLSVLAALLLGLPAVKAFTMSTAGRPSPTGGASLQRADFLRQVGGAAAIATAGISASPLASVAAARKCELYSSGPRET